MSKLTPDIFVELVMTTIEDINPRLSIERVGTFRLLVGGNPLELENLWRIVQGTPLDVEMTVFRFCEEILIHARSGIANLEGWVDLKPRIMPRIQPVSLFDRLERSLIAHRPWVNETVVTFVCDNPHSSVTIQPERFNEWQVSLEEVNEIALKNLKRYGALPELTVSESTTGGKLVLVKMRDGYDSSRILLEETQRRIAEQLGPTFYAGIPARDILLAFSIEPKPFVERIEQHIRMEFGRAPYPISPHSFIVTPDGVAGTIPTNGDDEAW